MVPVTWLQGQDYTVALNYEELPPAELPQYHSRRDEPPEDKDERPRKRQRLDPVDQISSEDSTSPLTANGTLVIDSFDVDAEYESPVTLSPYYSGVVPGTQGFASNT